jgi:hypothetical protein
MGFTKLDSRIIDSSIWDENANVLKIFITFWTKSDPDGIVDATLNSIYRSANLLDDKNNPISFEKFNEYLQVLLDPDKSSRTKINDGRRIVLLEESKWLVSTYKINRELTYSNNPESIRKREQRNSKRDMSQSVPGHSVSVSASVSASDSVSGSSLNSSFDAIFSSFWLTYPKKEEQEVTKKIFIDILKNKIATPYQLTNGVSGYNAYCLVTYPDDYPHSQYIKKPKNWLNDKNWMEDWKKKITDRVKAKTAGICTDEDLKNGVFSLLGKLEK